jgi:CDP-glucose 4,6-dehydratase
MAGWVGRSVLVTGATGFLGSHLTRALTEMGAGVVIISRDYTPVAKRALIAGELTCVIGDVTDAGLVERTLSEYEVATVFHLAAQSQVGTASRSPLATFETNITGTWAVLEACRRVGDIDILLASSDKVYGDHGNREYTEDMPLLANFPYDVSKACADRLAQTYQQTYGLRSGIVRCGNLFGPGDVNWNRIVPTVCRAFARGTPPVLRSDGKGQREYLYVDDAVVAYLLLAGPPLRFGGAFNFGGGFVLSPLELVDRIGAIAGGTVPAPLVEARDLPEVPTQRLSSAKAREALDWAPRANLDEALRVTYDWYRDSIG